jgi:hypothetical protein
MTLGDAAKAELRFIVWFPGMQAPGRARPRPSCRNTGKASTTVLD